jgi:hypothetical protein
LVNLFKKFVLARFPYFGKKERRLMRPLCCLCVRKTPSITFWMSQSIFMKLGDMYIMAPELISTAYFINPSRQTVCLCILTFIARQRLGKHHPMPTNIRKINELLDACLWICMCIPLSLLGNNSVKTFPRRRKIVGGVVSYVLHVVSKERGRNVFTRTSCLLIK